jgi:hypothetical protein
MASPSDLIPKQTITPGNGGFPVETTTLLDPIKLIPVTVKNGFVPPDLYSNWGNDTIGPLLMYTFAYDSLQRVKNYLSKNKVPTPIYNEKSKSVIFDQTKMTNINFYVEGAHRVIGNPGDGKLTENQLIEKYGRDFSQWWAWEKYGSSRAAAPGSSNHGFWKALDIYQSSDGSTKSQKIVRPGDGWKGPQDQFQAWFQKNGPAYGWFSVLMRDYKPNLPNNRVEPWHFEYFYDKDPFVQTKILEAQKLAQAKKNEAWSKRYMAQNADKPYKDPRETNAATSFTDNVNQTLSDISKTINNFFK